jgi:signal transduction histidine kinase
MEDPLLLLRPEARTLGVMVYKKWDKDLARVWVDGAQINQVFLNLLLKALRAMLCGGNSQCILTKMAAAC